MMIFTFDAEITVSGTVEAASADEAEELLYDYLEADSLTRKITINESYPDVRELEFDGFESGDDDPKEED